MKKNIELSVFIVALIACILCFFLDNTFITILLAISSLIYLITGWYLLNPTMGRRFNFVYFWIGYSFSTVFVTFILFNYQLPLVETFQYTVLLMLLIAIILMLSVKSVREKGIVENLIKTLLLIAIDIISIIV